MLCVVDGNLRMSRRLLEVMPLFTGSRLLVLSCIALHSDEKGIARCSVGDIAKATGLGKDTVLRNLKELQEVRFEGVPILIKEFVKDNGNRFGANRYAVFPYHQKEVNP